uniref:Uncharacterized protein n=1 Tax=Solanum lycopersicum TaxID=4081 RepID=A0A3Q7EZB6_SOLLC
MYLQDGIFNINSVLLFWPLLYIPIANLNHCRYRCNSFSLCYMKVLNEFYLKIYFVYRET